MLFPTLLALLIAASFADQAAADVNLTAVSRARSFMEAPQRGKFIMGYLHFGSTFDGQRFIETCSVSDQGGRAIDGEFALVYEFDWDNDGWTNVAFFFDPRGGFKGLRALRTNAVFNQPFLKANLAIAILGNAMIELFRSNMNPDQLRQAQAFIDSANAKGLLELALALQQSLGT
jgi:hypothetical protein